jgi:hypothetical protein
MRRIWTYDECLSDAPDAVVEDEMEFETEKAPTARRSLLIQRRACHLWPLLAPSYRRLICEEITTPQATDIASHPYPFASIHAITWRIFSILWIHCGKGSVQAEGLVMV